MKPIDEGAGRPHRKRCRRENAPGHAHALTFTCFRNQPFLSGDRARGWMIEAIRLACGTHEFHLWAYVLIPEHVHLLVRPCRPLYDVSAYLTTLKQSVAKRAVRFVRQHAPGFLGRMTDHQPSGRTAIRFWQRGGGYDRNVYEPSYLWQVIDYIHANPVRRGLCQRPEDWIWSSAADYAGTRRGYLDLDRASLPDDPRP
jgi:putative transposase